MIRQPLPVARPRLQGASPAPRLVRAGTLNGRLRLACPSGLGPREGAGLPKVTQPGGTEAAAAATRFPISAHPRGRGCWGSSRSPGSSRGLGEHRPGRARGRSWAGHRRPSHSDPVPPLQPLCASPPRLPGIRIRPGGGGWGRALKGAVQFPSRLGVLGEELESPDLGAGPGTLCVAEGLVLLRQAEVGPEPPDDPTTLDVPSSSRLVPTVPSTLFDLLGSGLGASNHTPPAIVASLEKATGPFPKRNSGSDRGWGLQSHLRLGSTSLGQINEATPPARGLELSICSANLRTGSGRMARLCPLSVLFHTECSFLTLRLGDLLSWMGTLKLRG